VSDRGTRTLSGSDDRWRNLEALGRAAGGRQPRGPKGQRSSRRRRVLGIASTPEGRVEQVAGLVRLGRLLGRVGERQFGPERDEYGRPVAPRQHRRADEPGTGPGERRP